MNATIRCQMSPAAESSGRTQCSRPCRGVGLPRQELISFLQSGRLRGMHCMSPSDIRWLLSGERRQLQATRSGCRTAAALSDTAALPASAAARNSDTSVAKSTLELLPQSQPAAAAASNASSSSSSTSTAAAAAVLLEGDGGSQGPTTSMLSALSSSSFEDLGYSSSMDLDLEGSIDPGEMCTLVADPSGDVQVVCESGPAHPLSLAEAAVYRPPLPPSLLQDIEAKLEADLITIAITILFAVGFIVLEFGVNDLIEHYSGDSLLSDVACVGVGLAVVFWVRLSKVRLMRFDRWR